MVDVLVQLHYLEQVVLEVLELLSIAFDDLLLRVHYVLELSDAAAVLLVSSVKFCLIALGLRLLVYPGLFCSFLPSELFNHLPKVLVFLLNVLEGALGLGGARLRQATPGVFCIYDSAIWL